MAKKIDLEFNDKKYTIEYNRESVAMLMTKVDVSKIGDDIFNSGLALIECGLAKHHQNDIPDRETIITWLFSMGDEVQDFLKALQECVQDVLNAIGEDKKSKNLKWGVRN